METGVETGLIKLDAEEEEEEIGGDESADPTGGYMFDETLFQNNDALAPAIERHSRALAHPRALNVACQTGLLYVARLLVDSNPSLIQFVCFWKILDANTLICTAILQPKG